MDKTAIPAENENIAADNEQDTAPVREEKTFSQKELDEIVRKRLERAKKDMPSKDEIDEFRQWKDERESFERKALENIAAANSAREAAENDKRALEIVVSCISKGVDPAFADDVITLAEKYAVGDISVDAAVDSVIGKYPMFCGKSRPVHGITTGIRTQAEPAAITSGKANFINVIKQNQVNRK